ncbi:hypothetical protein HOY80DRAFT_1047109 [Tuber brumale]|nr:hypothetical protein HOY80DRAFT_1047109 [Tuber brumale]
MEGGDWQPPKRHRGEKRAGKLPVQQQLFRQRLAVEYLQVAAEEHLVMNRATGTLGTGQARWITFMVSN